MKLDDSDDDDEVAAPVVVVARLIATEVPEVASMASLSTP
jgi:hypothetical protein